MKKEGSIMNIVVVAVIVFGVMLSICQSQKEDYESEISRLTEEYQYDYENGYEKGYEEGYNAGSNDGWFSGYDSGFEDGVEEGLADEERADLNYTEGWIDCEKYYGIEG